ncbi:hypothetical protein HELRODRAFT_178084 [Helobdella robusta]|uniref:E3 ubiquitin-protein ligase n=1 Tax=Helobdella robusta TaxID=6412 RepID=T1FCP6_HELRO|nr:hypothetical protein HELRODRAFT_178084 [Helobdella robusta]ESN97300.1 hypothetical protein HELRODRAFT_178084 [Helobdella robusta]
MLGQLAKIGTGCFDLMLDDKQCVNGMDIPSEIPSGHLAGGDIYGLTSMPPVGATLMSTTQKTPWEQQNFETPNYNCFSPDASLSPEFSGGFSPADNTGFSTSFSPAAMSPGSQTLASPSFPSPAGAFSPSYILLTNITIICTNVTIICTNITIIYTNITKLFAGITTILTKLQPIQSCLQSILALPVFLIIFWCFPKIFPNFPGLLTHFPGLLTNVSSICTIITNLLADITRKVVVITGLQPMQLWLCSIIAKKARKRRKFGAECGEAINKQEIQISWNSDDSLSSTLKTYFITRHNARKVDGLVNNILILIDASNDQVQSNFKDCKKTFFALSFAHNNFSNKETTSKFFLNLKPQSSKMFQLESNESNKKSIKTPVEHQNSYKNMMKQDFLFLVEENEEIHFKIGSDAECCICCDGLGNTPESVYLRDCRHVFHLHCLKRLYLTNNQLKFPFCWTVYEMKFGGHQDDEKVERTSLNDEDEDGEIIINILSDEDNDVDEYDGDGEVNDDLRYLGNTFQNFYEIVDVETDIKIVKRPYSSIMVRLCNGLKPVAALTLSRLSSC